MLEQKATLDLDQADLEKAIQYWLNREVLKNECTVTDIQYHTSTEYSGLSEDKVDTKTYKVSFIQVGHDNEQPDRPDPG